MVILLTKIHLFNPKWLSFGFLYSQDLFWPVCIFTWTDFIFILGWKWLQQICFHPLSPALGSPRVSLCTVNRKHTGARRRMQSMDSHVCYVSAVNPQIMWGCWAQLIWCNRSLWLALLEAQTFPRNAGTPASWRTELPPQLTGRKHFRSFFRWRKHLCDINILPLNHQSHLSSTG